MTPDQQEPFGLFDQDGKFESQEDIIARLSRPSVNKSLYTEATDLLIRAQQLEGEARVSTDEVAWRPMIDRPDLPIAVLMCTDIHYGAAGTDYQKLTNDLNIVENTPNFFMVTNGDHVDNFNAVKHPTGMYENPLSPQMQTMAFMNRMEQLGARNKIGVMSFGNHDDFIGVTGYDWLETFARNINAPIMTMGGYVHMLIGSQYYGLAMTHEYWGKSKLNPTNAAKRFWEHEYPQADIVFLGHTHQSEALHWERGGRDRIAIIGGTYKKVDRWATKIGLGRKPGLGGITLLLWPNERRMEVVKNIETAQEFIQQSL